MAMNSENNKKHTYIDMEDHVETGFEENFRVISPGRMVAKRFFKSKLSVVGLAMVIFVFVFSFAGPWIINATWKYQEIGRASCRERV